MEKERRPGRRQIGLWGGRRRAVPTRPVRSGVDYRAEPRVADPVAQNGKRLAVIVPVHNQPREIVACIEALLRAGVDAASIVVVDDASTDGTSAAARAAGAVVVRCPRNLGPAGARNFGAHCSRSDLILFVDSDVLVDPAAVQRVLSLMDREPDVSAGFGSYYDEPDVPGLVS